MGYYTLHKISIINKKYNNLRNLIKLAKVIEEVTEYTFRIESESYIIDDTFNSGYGSKWYSFDEDIYVISEKLPKFKILVEAKEENGTTWEKIVKNGEICYDYNSSDNSEDDEDEESEEDEENEYNEVEENNNDIGIEEMFQDMKINDEQIFRR